MYVANRASDKISQLTDNVYVCRSGSVSASQISYFLFIYAACLMCSMLLNVLIILQAADTQVISDYVRYFLHQPT